MNLRGFLSDEDVNTIKLTKGNIILEYEDANVGENKQLNLDPRHIETFFELEGKGSQNYVLDKKSLLDANNALRIRSSILPRPINVRFYSVAKEYDGTSDFDRNLLRYQIMSTSQSESGLILGSDNIVPYLRTVSAECSNLSGYDDGDAFAILGHEPMRENQKEGYDVTKNPTITINVASDKNHKDTVLSCHEEYVCQTTFPVAHEGDDFYFHANDFGYVDDKMKGNVSDNNSECVEHISPNIVKTNPSRSYEQDDKNTHYTEHSYMKAIIHQTLELQEFNNASNPTGKRFTASDVGKVLIDTSGASLSNKNVTNGFQELQYHNIALVPGPLGDVSKNYTINHVTGHGLIYPRYLDLKITAHSKVYDGTNKLSYDCYFPNRIVSEEEVSAVIPGDEVYVEDSIKIAQWTSKNVGATPEYTAIGNPQLSGKDSTNYVVNNHLGDYSFTNLTEVSITPREITASLTELRVVRDYSKFEINYYLYNTISGDDVALDFSNVTITTVSDKVIPEFFIGTDAINKNMITWTDSGNEIIVNTENELITLNDSQLVTISGLCLTGGDKENYTLTNTSIENIPLRIIQIY